MWYECQQKNDYIILELFTIKVFLKSMYIKKNVNRLNEL